MIISDELYESLVDGWENIMDKYFRDADALPHPRTQKMYNDIHAAFVIKRDDYFKAFGVTDDDVIDTCSDRMDRKKNTHPQTQVCAQLASINKNESGFTLIEFLAGIGLGFVGLVVIGLIIIFIHFLLKHW